MTNLEQFFSLLPKFSNLKIMVYGDDENLTPKIKDHCENKCIDVEFIQNYRKLQDRAYEVVIILNNVNFKLFKDCYHSLENSGNLIVVCKKSEYEMATIFEIIESVDYRAANYIDIFDDFFVVTAKKMHMWGNGF